MSTKEDQVARRRFAGVLIGAIVILAIMHVVTVLLKTHGEPWKSLAPWFDLDNETNVPAAYNAFLWAMCALLVTLLAVRARPRMDRLRFGVLAAFFLYLAFDEFLILHESFAKPVRNALSIHDGSPLYHAWVIPAIMVTLVLGGAAVE